ncbi:hypothetical protein CHISP_1989 [Chitinispirillum alkaliphilum]|nr:hypothetical protein CHISP_1989 [Chitinispirillum alkaliphilum]
MTKEIPKINNCDALDCIYNKEKICHTPAITVGDREPCCDTFLTSNQKGGFDEIVGGVGACKVSDCQFNNKFECEASGINVVMAGDHPDCGTYKSRG